MQTFTAALASFAAISVVTGSPILARDVCGSAPAASGSQAPLEQPSGVQTAQDCLDKCNANGQCQSFVFGLADGVIKCMLFPVPAAQVPQQATNLVVFDKACPSVPTVVPTTSNPSGKENQGSGNASSGNQSPNDGPNTDGNENQKSSGNTYQSMQIKTVSTVANTCGTSPTGPTTNPAQPLSQPTNIETQQDCLAQCKANPSCKAFEFGTEKSQAICKLFNVPAASVPAPSNGQDFKVFDVGCSL